MGENSIMFKWELKTKQFVSIRWIAGTEPSSGREFNYVFETNDGIYPKKGDLGICSSYGANQIFIITGINVATDIDMEAPYGISKKLVFTPCESSVKPPKIGEKTMMKTKEMLGLKTDKAIYKKLKFIVNAKERTDI